MCVFLPNIPELLNICCHFLFQYLNKGQIKMKLYVKGILFTILAATLIAGCRKENFTTQARALIQTGVWKIAQFTEDGNNETHHYTGYAFHFSQEGTVIATYQNHTVNGTWNTGSDDSSNKFNLSFSEPPFDELNEDWEITSVTSSLIKLKHVSGGNGGTDELHFEKM